MDFLLDNILLIAIILVCSVSLAWPMIQRRRTGPEVDNSSATELINRKNAQIIDLRDPKDFKKEAIANSVNIPADRIQNGLARCSSWTTTGAVPVWRRPSCAARALRKSIFSRAA